MYCSKCHVIIRSLQNITICLLLIIDVILLCLDSVVYDKLRNALVNKKIKKGICQASLLSQSSCLEGFHSVLNHFSPKMIAYSFQGMYCRYMVV